jgi:hypothetical protein
MKNRNLKIFTTILSVLACLHSRLALAVLRRALAAGAVIAALALSSTASGFSPWGFGPHQTVDLFNEPNNFYSFDGSEITWKFSDDFLAAFPNAQLQNQVRLAFGEWSIASSSLARRDSPRYHWVRSNGAREVYDLRSVVTHEIGHTLGSQHPDAAWFNDDVHKNYRYDDEGDLIAAPPLGGEIMNEGFQPGTLPDTKPPKGIATGDYWRTLSKDELLFLDYVYDRHITFTEVSGNTPAQITVTVFGLGGPPGGDTLGVGGPDTSELRDPNDPTQGRRINTASVAVDASPSFPLGIDPATGSWHAQNQTGKGIVRLHIRAEGTSNPQPLLVLLGNDPFNFTDYAPSNAVGVFDFENRGHIFSHSPGNFVPNGGFFDVALQLDVWDWYVTAANAITTDDEIIPVGLITILPFYQLGFSGFGQSAPAPGESKNAILVEEGRQPTRARGLKLVNSDVPTTVNAIAFADVEDAKIQARKANLKTWNKLVRKGRVHTLRLEPVTLGAGEEFYLLLEGDVRSLPPDVLRRGNYLVFDFPGLLDRKLLAWARSSDGKFLVQSLGLINDDPITSKPHQ